LDSVTPWVAFQWVRSPTRTIKNAALCPSCAFLSPSSVRCFHGCTPRRLACAYSLKT
jgi:hypothetical protein